MSSCGKPVCERKSKALICGNKMLPVRFGRPVASRSCCHNNTRSWSWTLIYLWVLSGKGKVWPSFISVSVSRPKAKQRLLREVGARAGNPPPAFVLARFGSFSSAVAEVSWLRARSQGKTHHEECSLCCASWYHENQHKPLPTFYLFSCLVYLYIYICYIILSILIYAIQTNQLPNVHWIVIFSTRTLQTLVISGLGTRWILHLYADKIPC